MLWLIKHYIYIFSARISVPAASSPLFRRAPTRPIVAVRMPGISLGFSAKPLQALLTAEPIDLSFILLAEVAIR
jgi:hypothetical protein